ncbi:MAG: hypothetical protein GY896_24495, partial [Gammaproteobacteria bacterium]|nr:hypothetical protein [Gammaproteobacteria bacterium]
MVNGIKGHLGEPDTAKEAGEENITDWVDTGFANLGEKISEWFGESNQKKKPDKPTEKDKWGPIKTALWVVLILFALAILTF